MQVTDEEEDLDHHEGLISCSEDFLVACAHLPSMNILQFPNFFLNFHNCVLASNMLVTALRESHGKVIQRVITFLARQPLIHSTYCTGPIRMKEAHTYSWESSLGPVQIGIPSETIKVSMRSGEGVPKIYVLPPQLFCGDDNFGEVEVINSIEADDTFLNPENRMIIIGRDEDLERVRRVFSESFYGPPPERQYVNEEIAPERLAEGYSIDFPAEFNALGDRKSGQPPPLSDFANFLAFDLSHRVSFSQQVGNEVVQVTVERVGGLLRFREQGQVVASVDSTVTPHAHTCRHNVTLTDPVVDAWEPPTFGVTYLGTSHGFDAHGHTTGFILWVNGLGVLVDPPTYSTEYLRSHGIPHSLVNKVILTHCHSDHDSGLLKQIIKGEKIELITTKTINESYKRKMNAVTGLDISQFYRFTPVPIGKPVNILGATFEFDYSFHTIPCLRFIAEFGGRSVGYSADTFYCPETYRRLLSEGVFNASREQQLQQLSDLQWLWGADVVIHECGVPPIHTPVEVLQQLPTILRRKLRIVHCASLPPTVTLPNGKEVVTDLHIPKSGLEATEVFPVSAELSGAASAARRFRLLADISWLQVLPPKALADLWFLLTRGVVEVENPGETKGNPLARLQRGAAFGETALRRVRGLPRSASVRSATECDVLCFHADDFPAVDATVDTFELNLSRITRMRPFVKDVLTKTYLFQNLSEEQVSFIAASLEQELRFRKGVHIIHEGDTDRSLYIIEEGSVRLERTDSAGVTHELMRLGMGDLFGELSLITGLPRTCSVVANEDTVLVELKQVAFEKLMDQFQNLRVKIALLVEHRLRESLQVDQNFSLSRV